MNVGRFSWMVIKEDSKGSIKEEKKASTGGGTESPGAEMLKEEVDIGEPGFGVVFSER